MAGNTTTPSAVTLAQSTLSVTPVLVGPLAHLFTVAPDFPFAKNGIKAIWRNEVGTAS